MVNQKSVSESLNSVIDHSVLFVLIVPSKAKKRDRLPKGQSQELWASEIGDELSALFTGATQMPPAQGKYFSPAEKVVVSESVILVHSYASVQDAEDKEKLGKLAYMLHRMGVVLEQEEVALIVDGVMHKITDYSHYKKAKGG